MMLRHYLLNITVPLYFKIQAKNIEAKKNKRGMENIQRNYVIIVKTYQTPSVYFRKRYRLSRWGHDHKIFP